MTQQSLVRKEVQGLVKETRARASLVGRSVAVLWALELADQMVFSGGLDALGVRPHSLTGLLGIPAAPFLHAGWGHLIANTVPFILLGFLATSRKRADFWVVAVASTLSAGIGAWVFGGLGSVHIGASGVVFGFLGFLMGRGIYERRAGAILLSVFVTVFFGGMLAGVLPLLAGAGISWQAHLFGYLGGLGVARVLGKELARKRA